MKKYFLDVGFNSGQSLYTFMNKIPDWREYIIHAFEPDERNFKHFNNFIHEENIIFHKSVVWTYDGTIKFYPSFENSVGSTVIKEKTTGGISKNNYLELQCLNLSKFIFENFSKEDYVILKMDIEGGEYKILRDLIETSAIFYLKELFVEFHKDKVIKSLNDLEHENLISDLKNLGFLNCDIPWEEDTIKLKNLQLYKNYEL